MTWRRDDEIGPVLVVHPVEGDETDGSWSIPPAERVALGRGLAAVLDEWAAAGPTGVAEQSADGADGGVW